MKSEALEETQEITSSSLPRKKILIADDDDLMRYSIGRQLMEAGFQVITAADGGEALDLLKKSRPDLIILDLMMPYVSGPEFLHLMQARFEPEKRVPVIIISAIDPQELREGGYKLEGYHFIPKPFGMEELIHSVNHTLSYGSS
jgi:DNA-binding response OmpR family regulator